MSNFSEYVNGQVNKSTDELVKRTVIKPVQAEDTIEDTVLKCNPETWTAREINNVMYLIYNKKIINITELKQKIADVYNERGYSNYGFAKLTERDLVRYTKVKNILMDSFLSEVSDELDTDYLAGKFFDKELKDFDWKPEEY